MRTVGVLVSMMTVVAPMAHADSGSAADPYPFNTTTPPLVESKDPGFALVLSIGLTGVGAAIFAGSVKSQSPAGLVIGGLVALAGPSTGRWYAGDDGLATLGLRAASGFAIYEAFVISETAADDDCLGTDAAGCAAVERQETLAYRHSTELLVAGAVGWIGTSVYDMVASYSSATRWNAVHIAPLATIGQSGGRVGGLVMTGTF